MKLTRDLSRGGETPALPPDSICGYAVLRALGPRRYLAVADGGRQVVLKPLDPDCLLQGQLHPSIKERLARVRELALRSAANLHGVERDQTGVFLVWEFIDGRSLEEQLADTSTEQMPTLMRELVLAVEALHSLGIIHGAIHSRNIIIDPAGRLRLTHVSPLLHHDLTVDATAVLALLCDCVERREERDTPLGKLVLSASSRSRSLRQLAAGLATLTIGDSTVATPAAAADDRARRNRIRMWALGIAVAGLFFAVGMYVVARTLVPPPDQIPSLDRENP